LSDLKGNRRTETVQLNIRRDAAVYTYLLLFGLVLGSHVSRESFVSYLVPLFLYSIPFYYQRKIKIRIDIKDIAKGILVSAAILIPFLIFQIFKEKTIVLIPVKAVLFQLFVIALPEEIYFRGFLQERLGNTVYSVLIVSVLFSVMHLPKFILYHDIYAVLTVFPSLIMGMLYVWTSNIITPTIFHVSANIVFLSCCDILR
jgi:membrane protease YdiL (CAAX protease family)